MIIRKTRLELIARTLIYSLIVILIDFVVVVFLQKELSQITDTLSFVLFFEGGICLIVGGAAAFYSPGSAKISEVLFHSRPWTAMRQKEVEEQAKSWIATGIFLVLAAILVSTV